jgi:exopolysaccharide biosynthesis polyprenyl glycosylphosphotransferase
VIRLIVRHHNTRRQTRSRVLIAGAGQTGARLAHALMRQWNGAAPVVGFLDNDPALAGVEIDGWPVLGTLDEAEQIIERHTIDDIIITLPLEAHPEAVKLVRRLQAAPVHIRLVPDFLDFAVMHASVDYLEGMPVVGLRVPAISDEARIAKRLFDITVSTVLLIILAPFMGLIALLIKRDSPGPALYKAERVGENGRLFRMYKFRTMVEDADMRWAEVVTRRPDGKLAFKQPDDPRITRIGRWLRRTSLDELPQLFNVLRGDMALVGPRPELPVVVREEYEPWQWSRFTVPQGMTGWWQINRRGFEHQHLCTADDLYYIQNYSLMLDVRILMRTALIVLTGQGAY